MALPSYFLCVLLCLVVYSVCCTAEDPSTKLSSSECLTLGFNSLALKCDTCETMTRFIGEDEQVYADCLNCCMQSETEEMYERAVLEVDKRIVDAFPNLPDIIKAIPSSSKSKKKDTFSLSDKAKALLSYPITIKYRFSARPYLYLYKSKDSEEAEKVTYVGSWNVDDFIDFVVSHLNKSDIVAK